MARRFIAFDANAQSSGRKRFGGQVVNPEFARDPPEEKSRELEEKVQKCNRNVSTNRKRETSYRGVGEEAKSKELVENRARLTRRRNFLFRIY
jgi:hypothetical protein